MSIHFASLIGVDLDLDLLPFWIPYYSNYGFDSYTVWLHSQSNSPDNIASARSMLSRAGWTFHVVPPDTFYNGMVRARYIGGYRSSLDPRDMLVVSDSDEFHEITTFDYRDMLKEHRYIWGKFLDRYDRTLHDANPCEPLDLQYPLCGHVEVETAEAYAGGQARWPRRESQKILASRAGMEVSEIGSHFIKGMKHLNDTLPAGGSAEQVVLHFPWRSRVFERMRTKTYFNAKHLWWIGKFFGIDNEELKLVLSDDIIEYERMEAEIGTILA